MTKVFIKLVIIFVFPFLGQAEDLDITPYENYLNSLQSVRAKFMQSDSQGNTYYGRFYLLRPRYMRLEYALDATGKDTLPLLIVSDGQKMIHYDKELKETTFYSFDATPAGFFLRDHFSLSEEVKVKRSETRYGTTTIEFVRADIPQEGSITLVFNVTPISLRKWIIKDPHGQETSITLLDMEENVSLPPELFDYKFKDPQQLHADKMATSPHN